MTRTHLSLILAVFLLVALVRASSRFVPPKSDKETILAKPAVLESRRKAPKRPSKAAVTDPFDPNFGAVRCLSDKYAVCYGLKGLYTVDLPTSKTYFLEADPKSGEAVVSTTLSADGGTLVTANNMSENGAMTVNIYRVSQKQDAWSVELVRRVSRSARHARSIRTYGPLVLVPSRACLLDIMNGHVYLRDLDRPEEPRLLTNKKVGLTGLAVSAERVAFFAKPSRRLQGQSTKDILSLHVLDLGKPKFAFVYRRVGVSAKRGVAALANFADDGQVLATVCTDGSVLAVNVRKRQVIGRARLPVGGHLMPTAHVYSKRSVYVIEQVRTETTWKYAVWRISFCKKGPPSFAKADLSIQTPRKLCFRTADDTVFIRAIIPPTHKVVPARKAPRTKTDKARAPIRELSVEELVFVEVLPVLEKQVKIEDSHKDHKLIKTPSSAASFAAILKSSRAVIVKVGTEWCPPCKRIAPVFHALAMENSGSPGVQFVEVNIEGDEFEEVLQVTSYPTFVLFRDGKRTLDLQSADKKKLEEFVGKATASLAS